MPQAIPLAITAAGAVASKIGQRNQQKKQNQYNQESDKRYNDINQGFGNRMSGIGDENRAQNQGILNSILGGAGSLWDEAGQGGPSYNPRMSESQGFYRNAMNSGLFDEGQKNDFRARGAIQNDLLFKGLQRQLGQAAAQRGGYQYAGQQALLSRDAARQAEENRLNTEGTLQNQIRQNMFAGGEGVSRNDADFARQGLAAAELEGRNLDRSLGARTGLLGLLQNLRTQGTNDLPYYNQAGDAYRNYRTSPEIAQQPWYGAVGDAAQGIGSGLINSYRGRQVSNRVDRIPSTGYRFNQLTPR